MLSNFSNKMYHRFGLLCSIALLHTTFVASKADSNEKSHDINSGDIVRRMKESIKLELWSRGSFALESMEDMVAAGAMQRVGSSESLLFHLLLLLLQ